MQSGKKLENLKVETDNIDIKSIMDYFNIEIKIENNETNFYINGKLAKEQDIQSKEASLAVSVVGGKADNRELLKNKKNIILQGAPGVGKTFIAKNLF